MMRKSIWMAVAITGLVFAVARFGYEARRSLDPGALRGILDAAGKRAVTLLLPLALFAALILFAVGALVLARRGRLRAGRLGVAARLARRGRSPARVARQTRLSQDAVRALARTAPSRAGRSSRSSGNPFRLNEPPVGDRREPRPTLLASKTKAYYKLASNDRRPAARYAPCSLPRPGRTVPAVQSFEEEPCR